MYNIVDTDRAVRKWPGGRIAKLNAQLKQSEILNS